MASTFQIFEDKAATEKENCGFAKNTKTTVLGVKQQRPTLAVLNNRDNNLLAKNENVAVSCCEECVC